MEKWVGGPQHFRPRHSRLSALQRPEGILNAKKQTELVGAGVDYNGGLRGYSVCFSEGEQNPVGLQPL